MRKKHVPQRTCIGCHKVQDKRQMIRLVRTPERQLVVDETGKRNGRGAYVCRQRSCWEAILLGNQLSRALKMEIGAGEKQALEQVLAALSQ
jgi:predicted RNA-binding protein YlxR (DUF448 family)